MVADNTFCRRRWCRVPSPVESGAVAGDAGHCRRSAKRPMTRDANRPLSAYAVAGPCTGLCFWRRFPGLLAQVRKKCEYLRHCRPQNADLRRRSFTKNPTCAIRDFTCATPTICGPGTLRARTGDVPSPLTREPGQRRIGGLRSEATKSPPPRGGFGRGVT